VLLGKERHLRIKITYIDGSEESLTASQLAFTADRVAFERQFGRSSVVLARMEKALKVNPDTGKKELDPDADLEEVFRGLHPDEAMAFFAWRHLRRKNPDTPRFDDFIEKVEDLTFQNEGDHEAEGEAENPTDQDQPHG
jgi:hypothetical protein